MANEKKSDFILGIVIGVIITLGGYFYTSQSKEEIINQNGTRSSSRSNKLLYILDQKLGSNTVKYGMLSAGILIIAYNINGLRKKS